MLAVILAGGKAKRMQGKNKAMVKLKGKELISYVIDALEESKKVSEIAIALRKDNKELISFIKRRKLRKKIRLIFTPCESYTSDLKELARVIKEQAILLPCDMPFLRGEIIDYLIEKYKKSDKKAASVHLPLRVFEEAGIKPSFVCEKIAPCSINFLDFSDLDAEEEKIIIELKELAFNINTFEELEIAEKEIERRKENF